MPQHFDLDAAMIYLTTIFVVCASLCASLTVCQSVCVPVCLCACLFQLGLSIMSDPVSLPGCVLFSVLTLGDLNMLQLASDDPLNYLQGLLTYLCSHPATVSTGQVASSLAGQLNSCSLLETSSKYPAQCSQCQVMLGSFQIRK